jgi:hypothetical protein
LPFFIEYLKQGGLFDGWVADCPVFFTVHDLLPIALDNSYPSPWRYVFRHNVLKAFEYASAFFCVSNFTKAMLMEFSYRQRTRPVPAMIAYNGFEPLVATQLRTK